MSVVIETLVICDECGQQNFGDDRHKNAADIRRDRKKAGWIQVGSKDYCDRCAPNFHKHTKGMK
jgi:hypothetical protein